MNTTKKLAALLLLTTATLSTHVSAQETGLEKIVANLVSNAVGTVSTEIDQQVQKITLTASNLVSVNGTSDLVGKVTITDLTAAKDNKADTVSTANTEEMTQNQSADDE